MNPRLVTPWKRRNSSQYWFRMVVPARYREAVSKTEVKQSLGTDDIGEARRLCAARQDEWLKRFAIIDLELRAREARDGIEAVDRHLDHQAARFGSMDKAIAFELKSMAIAEASFIDALSAEDPGLPPDTPHPLVEQTYPGFRDRQAREMIETRQWVMARTDAGTLPGYEAIARATSLDFLEIAHGAIEEAFGLAGLDVDEDDPRFAAAAKHLLHRLTSYPLPHACSMRASFPAPSAICPAPNQAFSVQPSAAASPAAVLEPTPELTRKPADEKRAELRKRIMSTSASARTLSEVYECWAATQPKEAEKLCDEWRVAIRRFVDLFGDCDVAEIDSDMIVDFREAMKGLPARPKRAVGVLPLLDQIDHAREHGLPTLAGPTVAKLVSGLRVTLDHACDPLRIIGINPAAAVKVKDATSDVDARLPFSPEDLKAIFAAPMMTDPSHPVDDAIFWLHLLAVLTGMRTEEMGKLRPANVRCERGIWYVAVERDSRRVRKAKTAKCEANKGGKTDAACRHIALHWLLIEAGFVDFAHRQQAAGHAWLFPDRGENKYGSRTKEASREIIRHIRSLGILDEEKVCHSFRHSMKRACRQMSMKEEIADLLAGHAPASVGRKYGAGAALDVLHDAVNLIEYDSIDWDPVIAAAKVRFG